MFRIITLILIMTTLSLSTAMSQEVEKDKDFFDEKERGWFWFENPPKEPEEKPLKPPIPQNPAPSPSKPKEEVALDFKWLKENLQPLMISAVNNPTEANLANYAYAQRLMLDMSSRFSSKMTDYMQGDSTLDESNRRPNSVFALNQFKTERLDVVKNAMDEIKRNAKGLWFFYASTCSYCKKMIPVMKSMKQKYDLDILAVSLDGGLIPGMEEFEVVIDYNNEVAKRFNVTLTPTTYMVLNNNEPKLVAEGLRALPELENRLLRTARVNKVISTETYDRTRSVYEQNIFNNKNGTLFVNKQKLENDPEYLSEALRSKLDNVKPYGTRVFNPK